MDVWNIIAVACPRSTAFASSLPGTLESFGTPYFHCPGAVNRAGESWALQDEAVCPIPAIREPNSHCVKKQEQDMFTKQGGQRFISMSSLGLL
jgi:hypothetical protein